MQKNVEIYKRDKIMKASTMQAYCRHFFIPAENGQILNNRKVKCKQTEEN